MLLQERQLKRYVNLCSTAVADNSSVARVADVEGTSVDSLSGSETVSLRDPGCRCYYSIGQINSLDS